MLAFVFVAMPTMAQDNTSDAVPELISVEGETEQADTQEVIEAPSGFGLWWQGVRENVSLAFTFDSIKKAEKRVMFAEERMRFAESFAENVDNPKAQKKAQAMIERAQKFMDKVEAKKDKWLSEENKEKIGKLMDSIANHQINREEIFNRIQERIPADRLGKMEKLREKGVENSRRLLNAIENENISEEVRERLGEARNRIKEHLESLRVFNEKRMEIINRVREGDEGAREELRELNQEVKEVISERVRTRIQRKAQTPEENENDDIDE